MIRSFQKCGVLALLFIMTQAVSGQELDTLWTRVYGEADSTPGDNAGQFCAQTSDDGYIIMGGYKPYDSPYQNISDFWLVKTDTNGDTIWTSGYGVDSVYEVCVSGTVTSNREYILAGYVHLVGSYYDAIVAKADPTGEFLWSYNYGGESYDQITSIIETDDGRFIGVGSTYSLGNGLEDLYVLSISSEGELLWQRAFGGSGVDWGKSICETDDGNYLAVGAAASFGAGAYDVYVVKISPDGDSLWAGTYEYGDEYMDEVGVDIKPVSDGGYVLTGYSGYFPNGDYDIYIQKIDSNYENVWVKEYANRGIEMANSIVETNDGGFLVAGGSRAFGGNDGMDNWILKTDSYGDTLWTWYNNFSPYEREDDIAYCIARTTEANNFVISGLVFNGYDNFNDMLFYKIKYNVTGIEEIELPQSYSCEYIKRSYPNPFNSTTMIEFDIPSPMRVKVDIYDVNGRYINTLLDGSLGAGSHSLTWNGTDYRNNSIASGIYFFTLSAGDIIESKKVVLIK